MIASSAVVPAGSHTSPGGKLGTVAAPGAGPAGASSANDSAAPGRSLSQCVVPPPLLAVIPEGIPAALKAHLRAWAPWQKVWDPKKGKYGKRPLGLGLRGASTKREWWSFPAALAAHTRGAIQGKSAGVGFNLKKGSGIVGVDLDRCVDAGVLEPWAKEVVDQLGSYTELSPSGRGVRVFLAGDIAEDWTNHPQGLEVYAGHEARFLTVTGHHLAGTPTDVNPAPAGAISWLEKKHKPVEDRAPVRLTDAPEILAPEDLPQIDDLELSGAARDFLANEGEPFIDESRALAVATLALFDATATKEGELRDDVVLSMLVHNGPAWEVATRHRPRTDDDNAYAAAIEYLWVHHCLKMKAKASPRSADEFECEEEGEQGAGGSAVALALVESAGVPAPPSEAPFADATQPAAEAGGGPPAEGEEKPPAEGDKKPPAEGDKKVPAEGDKKVPADASTGKKPRRASDLEYVDFATLAHTRPPKRRWTVDQWLAVGTLSVLYGPPGVGKSLLAEQLAIAVANGEPWLGLPTTQGPVIGLFCEDDENELKWRALYVFEGTCLDPAEAGAGLYLDARAGKPNALVDFSNDRVARRSPLMLKLQEQCASIRPALVILDNVAQLFTGLENDRGQASSFCNRLVGVARDYECSVLLLGHPAKAEGSEYSGSTAWEAVPRTRMFLERQKDGTSILRKAKTNYSVIDKIALEYRPPGLFVPLMAGAAAGAELAAVEEAKAALLRAVEVYTRRKRSTSHLATARNFVVKLMAEDGSLGDITRSVSAKALAALIDAGELVPCSTLGWRTEYRNAVYGLAPPTAAPIAAPPVGVNDE